MADGAFKTVVKGGKAIPEDVIEIKNKEKKLRDEGKLIYIRFEKFVKQHEMQQFKNEQLMLVHTAIDAAVNALTDTVLVSIDGKEEINDYAGFRNDYHAEKFVKPIMTTLKTVTRYAFIIKVKTVSSTFYDVKNTTKMMELLNKLNLTMRRHDLSPDQADTRLAFNIFRINPYYIGKNEHSKMVDKEIKNYAKSMNNEMKNSCGTNFCKWIESTEELAAEIGIRKISGDFTDENGQVQIIECVVLTITVEGRFLKELKDIIKTIKWDVRKFGTLVEENPSKVNDNIDLMFEHNSKWCAQSAYVKVNFLPEHLLSVKLPNESRDLETAILKKTAKDKDNKTTYLVNSINPIKKSTGLYILVTSKYLLETAEHHISELMKKASMTTQFINDKSLVNPDGSKITVSQKNSSKAGSEMSDISRSNQKKQVNTSSQYYKDHVLSYGRKKERNPQIPQTVECRGMGWGSVGNQTINGNVENKVESNALGKSYAEITQTTAFRIGQENNDGRDVEATEDSKPSASESVRKQSEFETLMLEFQLLKKRQNDLEKEQQDKEEKHQKELEEHKRAYINLEEKYKAVLSKQEDENDDNDTSQMNIGKLFVESPLPTHKDKRSKSSVSGMKRISISTNVATRETLPDGTTIDSEESMKVDSEAVKDSTHDVSMEGSPPKQQKTSRTLLSPDVQRMQVEEEDDKKLPSKKKEKEKATAKKKSSLLAATTEKILHPGGKPPGKGV